MARRQLEVSNEVAAELAGSQDQMLRELGQQLGVEIFLRGNLVTLDGEAERVASGATVVRELSGLVGRGHSLGPATIESVTRVLGSSESPAQVLDDVVWRHRNLRVAPKSVNQKKYVDAIREHTVSFGIGPAGTGKTFLAIAMAVAALSRREVNRIILTRPAVEAGERLGFLPGDLMAKVDPYLRPLFDAMNDMLDPERVAAHLEKGIIEVAPLAFMRGRAQPVDRKVLTPYGWQAIGTLEVGDLVVGSNGMPTPVLGVFPQGKRPVYKVTAQDGAATLCCGEHLWTVKTPEDRRRGTERTLRTDEMIGNERCNHQRRYELPVLSEPVEFVAQDVPIDAYAMGLLLGDGCLTTKTTPTFTTADPELVEAMERALPNIELRAKGEYDFVLRNTEGGRGGLRVANPVTVALRELGLAGTRSNTKFIPEAYRQNSSDVRLALLQGLLDSDGGPVVQSGRTCRVQYTTCSERLRDHVIDVVRSLGGVAYSRTRAALGRRPGRANGRPVLYRHDAFVLDIRLPAGMEPFRLTRKRERYNADGGGRPMRFIEAIEPAGEAETVCIQVGAQDSLYVTDDFLITHNTLNDSFVILDEAQNTSPEQMKMFLTRLGFGSKMVVNGDVSQIDLPREQRSGLVEVGEILRGVEGVSVVHFGNDDVVRHKIVQRIVQAYADHAEQSAPDLRSARGRSA